MTKRLLVAVAAVLAVVAPSLVAHIHADVVPTNRVTNQVAAGAAQKVVDRLPSYPLLTH